MHAFKPFEFIASIIIHSETNIYICIQNLNLANNHSIHHHVKRSFQITMHYYYYKYFVLNTGHSPWTDRRLPMTVQYFIFEKLKDYKKIVNTYLRRKKKGHDSRQFFIDAVHQNHLNINKAMNK